MKIYIYIQKSKKMSFCALLYFIWHNFRKMFITTNLYDILSRGCEKNKVFIKKGLRY